MTANIAAGRSDVHSAVRVVSLVLEGIPFPVARNEVTSEAVFKRLRIVKIVKDVDFVRITGADRLCSAFEVASIVASVYDIFFLADFTGLVARVASFADGQTVHYFRNVVFQRLNLILKGHKFRIVHAHARSPSFTLIS